MEPIIIFGEKPDQTITIRARQFILVEHPWSADACNEDGAPEFHFATREEAQEWLDIVSDQVGIWECIAEMATEKAREDGMRALDVLLAPNMPKPIPLLAYSRLD